MSVFFDWYDNGRRRKKCEIPINKDKAEGIGKWFRENGSLEWEIEYKEGKKNGKSIGYDLEGKKCVEIHFVNDIKNGLEIRFYPNKMRSEIFYLNGKKNGEAKWFREDGKLSLRLEYKNGVLVECDEIVDFSKMLKKKKK